MFSRAVCVRALGFWTCGMYVLVGSFLAGFGWLGIGGLLLVGADLVPLWVLWVDDTV